LAAIENYEKFLTLDELTINVYPIQRRYEIRPSMTVSGIFAAIESKGEEKPAAGK
jgi:hypothetical protein